MEDLKNDIFSIYLNGRKVKASSYMSRADIFILAGFNIEGIDLEKCILFKHPRGEKSYQNYPFLLQPYDVVSASITVPGVEYE